MNSIPFDPKRFLRLLAAVIAAVPLFFLIVTAWLAFQYTQYLLYVPCQGDFASLAELGYPTEAVTLRSADGVTLRGWYTPGTTHPETAIIVISGHAGNTRAALPDAQLVAEEGYSTLIYEHRVCADPSLPASTGPHEARDSLAAVETLQTRPDVQTIGVLGFSEGGTASLLAAADEPAIDLVVAIGGYSSLREDILEPDNPSLGWYERLIRRVVLWWMPLRGVSLHSADPEAVIRSIDPRPVLLIYGEHEASHGETLYAAAGPNIDLVIIPGVGHGGYRANYEPYHQAIVTFLEEHTP